MLRSSEPWTSTTRGAPGGPGCSATKRSATAAHARTLDPWSCCSSATRCRCASTRESSTAPPTRPWPTSGRAQAAALAEWLADEDDRRDLVQPDAPRPRDGGAAGRRGWASTSPIEDGIAEYDRDAASYIPVEELKAANDPRWYQVPEQPEHFRAVVVEAVERIVAAHPRPARRGGVPRRRDQRVRGPRARHRRPAVLPARPTRRSAACWRRRAASAASPASTRPPTSAASDRATTRARARSPRTEPSSVPMV